MVNKWEAHMCITYVDIVDTSIHSRLIRNFCTHVPLVKYCTDSLHFLDPSVSRQFHKYTFPLPLNVYVGIESDLQRCITHYNIFGALLFYLCDGRFLAFSKVLFVPFMKDHYFCIIKF